MTSWFWRAGTLLLLLVASAPATTFARLSTADLVRRAERVSCAVCESCVERRDSRSGVVFTHVRLRLLEDLKGVSPGATIRLRLVGGTAGGVRTVVAGMPRFTPGEESILLLGKENADGYPVVVQARRGVIGLRRDKRGRRHLAAPVTGMKGLKDPHRVTLDAFRGAVQRVGAKR